MESDRGAELAALVPPVSLATQISDEGRSSDRFIWHAMGFETAATEVTRGTHSDVVLPADEDDDDIRAEIDSTFQRKLAAIRRMPKRDRPFARRAATDERDAELLGLRERREIARQFKRYLLRLLAPKPQG